MAILTAASYVTKRVNKSASPYFLRWSLRMHEWLASSSSSSSSLLSRPWLMNGISLLPMAQRIVSIEVQDDYRQVESTSVPAASPTASPTSLPTASPRSSSMLSSLSTAWNEFVEQAWDIFFESRESKQRALPPQVGTKRRQKWSGRGDSRDGRDSNDKHEEKNDVRLQKARIEMLERYVLPSLLSASQDGIEMDSNRALYRATALPTALPTTSPTTSPNLEPAMAPFVKWLRGEYLIAKYGFLVRRSIARFPELRDGAITSYFPHYRDDGASRSSSSHQPPLEWILPSVSTVQTAFGMHDWNQTKESSQQQSQQQSQNQFGNQFENQSKDSKLEWLLQHHLQGRIRHAGMLNAYFEMRRREDSYELWTYDYIFALASYLLQRVHHLDTQTDENNPNHDYDHKETIILDVGAGDGRLIYFLRRAMTELIHKQQSSSSTLKLKQTSSKKKNNKKKKKTTTPSSSHQDQNVKNISLPTLIATDDGSWNAPRYDDHHDLYVEPLSVHEALIKYGSNDDHHINNHINDNNNNNNNNNNNKIKNNHPNLIVLCSWMPPGQDWTALFRGGTHSNEETTNNIMVDEYILIGECDDGTCGHNWYTWGNPLFHPDLMTKLDDMKPTPTSSATTSSFENVVPPYKQDGYTRVELDQLSKLQFSRFDTQLSSESKTVSFRKKLS